MDFRQENARMTLMLAWQLFTTKKAKRVSSFSFLYNYLIIYFIKAKTKSHHHLYANHIHVDHRQIVFLLPSSLVLTA